MSQDDDLLWNLVKFNNFLSFECSVARVYVSQFKFTAKRVDGTFDGFSDFGMDVFQNYLHIGIVCETTAVKPLKKNKILLLKWPSTIPASFYEMRDHSPKKVRTLIFCVPYDVYKEFILGNGSMDEIFIATSVVTKVEHWRFVEYEVFSSICRLLKSEEIKDVLGTLDCSELNTFEVWRLLIVLCSSSKTRKKFRKLLKERRTLTTKNMIISDESTITVEPVVSSNILYDLVSTYIDKGEEAALIFILVYSTWFLNNLEESSNEKNDTTTVPVLEIQSGSAFSPLGENDETDKEESAVSDDESLKCHDCGDEFEDADSFYQHTKSHKNYRKYRCKLCGIRFQKSSGLKNHILAIHTGERPYACDICAKTFPRKDQMERHKNGHFDIRNFPCDVCPKLFSSKRNLEVHMRTHTGEKPFACKLCDRRFTSRQNWKFHERVHYDVKSFVCKFCGRSFSRNGTCKYHMKIQHEDKKDVAFKCYSCKHIFSSEVLLLTHAKVHDKKKTFECKVCFKKFDVKSELREHADVHSKDKPFACGDCGMTFFRKMDRDRHQIKHKGEPTVMCSFCGKGFFVKFDCRRHELLIHEEPSSHLLQKIRQVSSNRK